MAHGAGVTLALALYLLGCVWAPSASAMTEPLLLNCGSDSSVFSEDIDWAPDQYFLSGRSYEISAERAVELQPHAVSLRAFGRDEVSCYRVPVPPGKYRFRLGFAYNNYDGLDTPPAFSVYVEGVLVATVDFRALQAPLNGRALYKDFVSPVLDGNADTCLRALVGNETFVNSVELYALDEQLYSIKGTDPGATFSSFVRINSGGSAITSVYDPGFRNWEADVSPAAGNYTPLALPPGRRPLGANEAPYFLPPALVSTAQEAGPSGVIGYGWTLDPVSRLHKWLVLLYFAELDPSVRLGERVFSIYINGLLAGGFDVLAAAGGQHFRAVAFGAVVNQTLPTRHRPSSVVVRLQRAEGSKYNPLVCGVSVYELIDATVARESIAAEVVGKVLPAPKRDKDLTGGEVAAILLGGIGGAAVIGAVVVLSVLWKRHVASLDALDDVEAGGVAHAEDEVLVHSRRLRSDAEHQERWLPGAGVAAGEGSLRGSERGEEDIRIFTQYREA